jgi:hypothetical protein
MTPHNKHRGEIAAVFSDKPYRLVLTLGALAELESTLASSNLMALAERFSSGKLSAHDLIALIGAGLRGAGHDVDNEKVASLTHEQGAVGFANVASALLSITFGGGEAVAEVKKTPRPSRGMT